MTTCLNFLTVFYISPCLLYSQCIIFLRDYNSKNQEVSGYIDFAYRIKTENFEPYFEGEYAFTYSVLCMQAETVYSVTFQEKQN